MRPPMSWDVFYAEIDRRLSELRPAVYNENDWSWMKPVMRWAERNMPRGLPPSQAVAD